MSESFDPIPASERHHASVKSNGNAPASNSPAVADANKQQGDAIKKEELEAHIKSIAIHKDHTQYLKTVVNLSPQAFFQQYLGTQGSSTFANFYIENGEQKVDAGQWVDTTDDNKAYPYNKETGENL